VIDDAGVVVEPVVEGEPGLVDAARYGAQVGGELVFAIEVAPPERVERDFFLILPEVVVSPRITRASVPGRRSGSDRSRGGLTDTSSETNVF
jgi:hypothetical protein